MAMELGPEQISFEEALSRLEEIVELLERGDLSLEEALERFREGARLRELCERKLAEAQATIEEYLQASSTPEQKADQ